MSKATRRHHRERLMKKRKNYWSYPQRWSRSINKPAYVGMTSAQLSKVTRTPKPCSCWMCRNERQDCGPTLQELRNDLDVATWTLYHSDAEYFDALPFRR